MERKFSVIIPSLNKCPGITRVLVDNLLNDNNVGEIIIIDNTDDGDIDYGDNPKLVYSKQYDNMYVNPSWNIGVNMAKYDYIALINDDVTIPDNIFQAIAQVPLDDLGIIGANHGSIVQKQIPERFHIQQFGIQETNIRNWGFGIFMVMAKKNYIQSPIELLIWCHDDILFHRNIQNGKRNGVFLFPIQTKMSTTSDLSEFDKIKQHDLDVYNSKYKI